MEVIGHAVSMCEAVKEELSPASSSVWDAGGLCGGAAFPHMVQKLFTHSHCFQNKIQSSIKWPSRFPLSWSLLPSLPALLPCTSFPCQTLCDKRPPAIAVCPLPGDFSPLLCSCCLSLYVTTETSPPQRPTQFPYLLCQVSECLFPSLDFTQHALPHLCICFHVYFLPPGWVVDQGASLLAACPTRFLLHLNALYNAWHLPAVQGMFATRRAHRGEQICLVCLERKPAHFDLLLNLLASVHRAF